MTGDRRILLGHVTGAHGIRGEVLIKTHTAVPEAIASYGPLTDEHGTRVFEVSVVRATAKGLVARVSGIVDRTAADRLKGANLYIDRSLLPETARDDFYHADLIGLAAVDGAGATIGAIVAVLNYGAGDLLEVRLEGSRRTELVPFSERFVPQVDLANRRITVTMNFGADGAGEPDEA